MSKEIKELIPTNVITEFLGVGKTTAIQHLLAEKPKNERWAVLVNEFGEVGIDLNLFTEEDSDQRGITISQVPGGCMCCTNGLPMQMALNLLLAKSKPHRLLIEPTGLGHPKEVLAILSGEYYRDVLNLQSTIALVDSRKIQDERYIVNSTFKQQLEVAEVIIANKADLYTSTDFPALLDYIDDCFGLDNKLIYQVQHGAVDVDCLNHPATFRNIENPHHESIPEQATALPPSLKAPEIGFIRKDNAGEGFFSRGWIFSKKYQFEVDRLHLCIQGMELERLKGVFNTEEGWIGFNKVDSVVTKVCLNGGYENNFDSRVEAISNTGDSFEDIEALLLDCVLEQGAMSEAMLEIGLDQAVGLQVNS